MSVLIHIESCLNDRSKRFHLILFAQISTIAALRSFLLDVLLEKQ